MSTAPLKVVCTGCSSKFHVAEQLVRGKVVKFRCRKCRAPIEVDGTRIPDVPPSRPSVIPSADSFTSDAPSSSYASEGSSTRLSISDGLEGLSGLGLPRIDAPPPPAPVFPRHDEASMRRPSDPFGLRRATVDPMLAPPQTHTTPVPVTTPQGYSDAPTEIEVEDYAALAGARTNRIGRPLAYGAVLLAVCLTGWGLLARQTSSGSSAKAAAHQGRNDAPSATASRMEPSDFQGVTANPAARAKPVDETPEAPQAPVATAVAPSVTPPATPATAVANTPAPAPTRQVEPNEPTTIVAAPEAHHAAPVEKSPPRASAPAPVAAVAAPPTVATPVAAQAPAEPAVAAPGTTAAASDDDFNTNAARVALDQGGQRAWECRTVDTPAGAARVAITFAPTGRVTSAVIEAGPFAGTAAGGCVVSKFRSVRVPPFAGENVTVHKTVSF